MILSDIYNLSLGSQSKNNELIDKILPTVISSFIIITLFVIGRRLDNKFKYKEIERNWYLKVIIDPNIDKVSEFYVNTSQILKESIEKLIENKKNLTYIKYVESKSFEIGRFQTLKRKFELEFIYLVQSTFPDIANELTNNLITLEDDLTIFLDSNILSNDDFVKIESTINNAKYNLIRILFIPLSIKK